MKLHTAIKKDHQCTICKRLIPLGARYWSDEAGSRREHTNCELFTKQEVLPDGYNQNRSLKK